MSNQAVVRRIPYELNHLLDTFHNNYKERFCEGKPELVTKTFTDRVFAHMYSDLVFEKLAKGKITLKPTGKFSGRKLEIDYSFENFT